ncbi:MAG TPA: hypothetical protein VK964_16045 [Nocardioidaceae bacterium]|nr:hypothetical protein [Nocardioidaceae bacterium]
MRRSISRGVLVPVVAGSVALVLALVLAYVTIRDIRGSEPVPAAAGTGQMPTHRMVSKKGGFAVAVPDDLTAEHAGTAVRMVSASKDLVVVAAPAGDGPLPRAEKRVLKRMDRDYPEVSVLGREQVEVDGHPGQTVFGRAVNDAGARLRFAVTTVHADGSNFTLAAYTAFGADPAEVLPRVNAIANGFEVLTRGR